ncbi:MAG: ZIP family metal transporter [Chlamydiae bacterium]|nr:ZIP family metal transporter [Chlamydiota bacterium]MBI3277244.1 ZIP family metal transporter [Chlamydiota bacterium]
MILIGLCAFLATFLGGLFALKFKDKLHLFIGFSAGAVIGVAFFDLLPEAIELGNKVHTPLFITSLTGLGFVIYMLLDRTSLLHSHPDEACKNPIHHERRGQLGAGSLSLHSLIDGIAIGLAFQVSQAVGITVAIAVLVHDFSDGINTVSIILKNGGEKPLAFRWLLVDALAPLIGIFSTLFFTLTATVLGALLAIFGGFFLYIGASDLLPESHHSHPTRWTTFMTLLGILVLYIVIRFSN